MARIRDLQVLAITGALVIGLTGCMIPVYHQPQGFSSTYYRHLLQSVPVTPVTPAASTDLAQSLQKDEDAPELDAEADDEQPAATAEKSGSWWSWIRRPILPRQAVESEPDEDDAADKDSASAKAVIRQ